MSNQETPIKNQSKGRMNDHLNSQKAHALVSDYFGLGFDDSTIPEEMKKGMKSLQLINNLNDAALKVHNGQTQKLYEVPLTVCKAG